jgi:CubicO group peptidase (beta-lactamase class C family)
LITADRRRYNTDILGCVVERASGLSLDRFIAGRTTKPLGLSDTHFFLPAAGGALDGVRIISPRTVALMTTNQVGMLHSTRGLGFGLGFQTVDRYGAHSLSSVGSYGWSGAYGSHYLVDPQARLVIVFMIQMLPNRTEYGQLFPTLVYQALLDTPLVRP